MSNYAPALPLTISPKNGYENLQEVKKVILQNMKMIVLTSPGERIMDPFFGVGVRRYLFEQNTEATHLKIKTRIKKQIGEYMPFVQIRKVDISSDLDQMNFPSNSILITIEFSIENIGVVDRMTIKV